MPSTTEFNAYRDFIERRRNETFASGNDWDGRAIWQPMKNSLSEEAAVPSWSIKVDTPERVAYATMFCSSLSIMMMELLTS
ncbi:unnamed protein product [Phytophthora lilii]|uniref:Unnamed protein product n=1 Tax=Phytophthora lilii TaxID=2077276 RepID=A0A9W6WZ58_9STRA|nr:unnamed protein product [Phytophthora lilii]